MSRTLSMNSGSGESLNASVWWGLSPKGRQIRLIALWLMPARAAIRPCRPVGGVRRLLLERLDDLALDVLIADRARLAQTRLVVQSIKTALGIAPPPAADGRAIASESCRDRGA